MNKNNKQIVDDPFDSWFQHVLDTRHISRTPSLDEVYQELKEELEESNSLRYGDTAESVDQKINALYNQRYK